MSTLYINTKLNSMRTFRNDNGELTESPFCLLLSKCFVLYLFFRESNNLLYVSKQESGDLVTGDVGVANCPSVTADICLHSPGCDPVLQISSFSSNSSTELPACLMIDKIKDKTLL